MTVPISNRLSVLAERYDALLCDVWGVIHNGRESFPAAYAALERFITERLVPNEMRIEIEDQIPKQIIAEMREIGLFGLTIPRDMAASASMRRRKADRDDLRGDGSGLSTLLGTNIGTGARSSLRAPRNRGSHGDRW